MAQNSIKISETPPLPGLQLVQQANAALQSIATDFAGPNDPAAMAGPYMTWADTGNALIKRRNAAGSAWVIEGRLFVEPWSPANFTPTNKTDKGSSIIYDGATVEFAGLSIKDLVWSGNVDLPSPYVLTGLRRGEDGFLYPRGRALKTAI